MWTNIFEYLKPYLWNLGTLLVAIFSLILSLVSIYLQFKKGKLIIPKIKCMGIIIESLLDGEFKNISCVMPILFYNTGNGYIGVSDVRLKIILQGQEYLFKFNQFVLNLGFDQNGSPKFPNVLDWAHQFIIPPKTSILHYIHFNLKEKKNIVEKLNEMRGLDFNLQIKKFSGSRFKTYHKFKLSLEDNCISNYLKYNLYEIIIKK